MANTKHHRAEEGRDPQPDERYDLGLLSVGWFRPGCDGGSLAALDLLHAVRSRGLRVCAVGLYPNDEWANAVRTIESWFRCSLIPRPWEAAGSGLSRTCLHEARGCELPLLAAPLSEDRRHLWQSPLSALPEIVDYLRGARMRSTLTADCDHLSPLAAFLENIPGLHLFNSLANVREVAVFGHGARRVLATRRLFTVSQFLREQIRHRLSLEASVIYPIWGLEDYRVASQKPVTGAIGFYAGGVPRAKGDEIVLAAARLLPDTRFLVVGSTLYRGSYDLPNNIFELGRLRDMRSFYSQIDLLLAPSIEPEGFPRVVVEAAFNGIPSIASRAGGLPEAVGDGGVLLPIAAESESEMHASGRSVAEAIRGLLASPDRLLELGSLARSHAERLRQLRDLQLWERAGVVSSPQASGK